MLKAKSDTDLLFYSLSHFECDGHTVHMLTQWHLLPPLTKYNEVVIVHTRAFQSTLLGCQVTLTMVGLFLDRPHILSSCLQFYFPSRFLKSL